MQLTYISRLLSGITITSLPTLHSSLHQLHTIHHVTHVAFSSIPLPASLVKSLKIPSPPQSYTCLLPETSPPWYDAAGSGTEEDDVLVCFASTWVNKRMETWGFSLPTVRGYFSGVGDLFSAMVLAHFDETETQREYPPLIYAVSKALLAVQQILLKTHLYSLSHSSSSGTATPRPLHHLVNPVERPSAESLIPSDLELDSGNPKRPNHPKRKAKRMRIRELRIVQERALLAEVGSGWPGAKLEWDSLLR